MSETTAERIDREIGMGRVDLAEVRKTLDQFTVDEVVRLLGHPAEGDHVVTADPGIQHLWHPGEGRPALANEDPAVMAAMGRCAAAHVWVKADRLQTAVPIGGIHGAECGWCDYPQDELLKALEWFTWWSQLVLGETLTWRYGDGWYGRPRPGGHFANPRISEWAALDRADQRARVQRVIDASRSQVSA